jgi:hypothetical protein
MATVFNGNTLTITLDAPVAGVLDLDIGRLYSEWKEWQLSSFQNMGYPPAFRTIGGDALTPGITAGAYYFLRNDYGWRIKTTEEDQTVYAAGNLAPQDSTLPILVPTTGDFTVGVFGLQPITQNVGDVLDIVQANQYNNNIYYDENATTSGTARPFGTAAFPVNNEADLLAIAARESIRHVVIQGELTLTQAYVGWTFVGDNREFDHIHLNGQNVNDCAMHTLHVGGAGSGSVTITNCSMHGVSGIGGNWTQVGIVDTLTLSTTPVVITHSVSEVAGTGRPVVDCNSVVVDCAFRQWVGGMELTNLNQVGAAMTVDGDPVRLRMTATCTSDAELVVGGNGIVDGNLGTIVPVDASFVSNPNVAAAVMSSNVESTFTLQDVMQLLGAIAAGDIVQQTDGSYVIKGLDDSTNRILGELATNNGRTITGRNVA